MTTNTTDQAENDPPQAPARPAEQRGDHDDEQRDQLGSVAARADDVEPCPLEQARQPSRRRTSSSASATRIRLVVRPVTIG
jgi:hypothetical protein